MAVMRDIPDVAVANQKDQQKRCMLSLISTFKALLALMPKTTTAVPITRTGEEEQKMQ